MRRRHLHPATISCMLIGTWLTGCSWGGPDSPSIENVEIPRLSSVDASLFASDQTISEFLETTSELPTDATTCEEQTKTIGERSIQARAAATPVEDAELRDLIVNHSSAVWDYMRICAAGDGLDQINEELAFYQEALEQWLDAP